MGFAMNNLVDALIGNAKLPREFSLRDTVGVAVTNEGIALLGGEGVVTRREGVVYNFEGSTGEASAVL